MLAKRGTTFLFMSEQIILTYLIIPRNAMYRFTTYPLKLTAIALRMS